MAEFIASKNKSNAEDEASNDSPRIFTMLENNPSTMTALAHQLGMSPTLAFHDVYSIYDSSLLSFLPRPIHALLVTIPLTPSWERSRTAEDASMPWYAHAGSDERVFWLQQTIIHGCGLIGLLHCLCNGAPAESIMRGSQVANFLERARPLHMDDRAKLLYDDLEMYEVSERFAVQGDTVAMKREAQDDTGNHFVALVKGSDGHLWELEGGRKGPIDRGLLGEDEDAISERALDLGLRRLVEIQRGGGGEESDLVRFSCIALGPNVD